MLDGRIARFGGRPGVAEAGVCFGLRCVLSRGGGAQLTLGDVVRTEPCAGLGIKAPKDPAAWVVSCGNGSRGWLAIPLVALRVPPRLCLAPEVSKGDWKRPGQRRARRAALRQPVLRNGDSSLAVHLALGMAGSGSERVCPN